MVAVIKNFDDITTEYFIPVVVGLIVTVTVVWVLVQIVKSRRRNRSD